MTAIDRTAYPCPGESLTAEELSAGYNLSEPDLVFIRSKARGDSGRLTLATLLKARQDLGYFPALGNVHIKTVMHLASLLGIADPPALITEIAGEKTIYRYRNAVRIYLEVSAFDEAAEQLVIATVIEAAATMSDPADLINRAIEALGKASIDLPVFSTLDRLANHLRTQIHRRMYDQVASRLRPEDVTALDTLLIVPPRAATTPFNRLKQTPGPVRPETIKLWTERLDWLSSLIDPDPALEGIAFTKRRQFAAETRSMTVSDLLDISRPGKRHLLMLCLIQQAHAQCRDELIEMVLRRVRKTQAAAKEKLKALQDQHREIEEALIAVLGQVLETTRNSDSDAHAGQRIRALFARARWRRSLVGTM